MRVEQKRGRFGGTEWRWQDGKRCEEEMLLTYRCFPWVSNKRLWKRSCMRTASEWFVVVFVLCCSSGA